MSISNCIKNINGNSRLPSFTKEEISQIEGFKENYKDQPEEVADRLAARDYAKFVNEGLNNLKSAIGEKTVEVSDEIQIPEGQEIPQESILPERSQIEADFRETFNKIQTGIPGNSESLTQDALKVIGDGVRTAESRIFNNKATRAASKITAPIRKAVNDYLDSPASILTKGAVKGIKKAVDTVARKASKTENEFIKEIKKVATRDLITKATATGLIRGSIDSLFPNINLTESQQESKRSFQGEKGLGKEQTARLITGLQSLPSYNYDSMRRIHEVMDAEAATNVTGPESEIATLEDLSADERQMYDYLRGINDYIHELNYAEGLIDQGTYDKYKGKYIARLYEQFEDAEFDRLKSEGAIDETIYKARKELSEELDSVRDPVYLTMKRFSQTMQNVAVSDYIKSIASDQANFVTPEEFESLDITEKGKYTMLKSKGMRSFGELEGMYVENTFAEDLLQQEFLNPIMNTIHGLMSKYDRNILRQMTKQGLTVFNPMTRLVNIVSGFHFANIAGVDGISFARNRVVAKQEYEDVLSEDVEFLFRKGVLSMSNINPELNVIGDTSLSLTEGVKRKSAEQQQDEEFKEMISPLTEEDKVPMLAGWNKVFKMSDAIAKAAKSSYGRSDDIAKIAAFKSLVEQGFSRDESASKVAKAMQNYSSVGKAFSLGAKVPFVGNAFVRFQADLLRIMANAMIDKPVTTSLYVGSLWALSSLTSDISGESDEEEFVRTERPFIPRMMGMPLVWKIGEKYEFNMAKYMTPYYTYDLGTLDDNTLDFKFSPVAIQFKDGKMNFKSGDPTLGWLRDLTLDRDFRGKSISNPENNLLDEGEVNANRAIYALRNSIGNVLPVKLMHDLWLSATTGQDYYKRNRSISDTFLSRIVKIEKWEDAKYKEAVQDYIRGKDTEINKINFKINKANRDLRSKYEDIMAKDLSEKEKFELMDEEDEKFIEVVNDLQTEIIKLNSEKFEFAERISESDL